MKRNCKQWNGLLGCAFIMMAAVLCQAETVETAGSGASSQEMNYNVARPALGSQLFFTNDEVMSIAGTGHVAVVTPDSMVSDDKTLRYRLPEGRSLAVLDLVDDANIEHFTFFNHGAAGTFTVAIAYDSKSAEDGKWQTLVRDEEFFRQGPVTVPFPDAPIKARLVRVIFQATTPGEVGGLGVSGQFVGASPRGSDLIYIDEQEEVLSSVTSPGSEARVVAVSGTMDSMADLMIDDLVDTYYDLPASDKPAAVLLDLGEFRQIERVSVLANGPPGEVDVYFLNEATSLIPDGEATAPNRASLGGTGWGAPALMLGTVAVQTIIIDPANISEEWPSVTVMLPVGEQGAGTNFEPRNTRYVLFVWRNPGLTRVYELCVMGRYRWDWEGGRPIPAEGPGVQPGSFSPPLSPPVFPDPSALSN